MQEKNSSIPSIFPVTCHTDYVGKGSTFVAIKGQRENGIEYINIALKKGATTIVVPHDATLSEQIIKAIHIHKATLRKADNTRNQLALLSAQATKQAHTQLKFIGITGTKGKTSTAFILEHILRNTGHNTALVSTVYNKIKNQILTSTLTTDQPDYLHQFFATCVEQNVEFVIMEVAAQALSLHRVAGIIFDEVVFTNFDHEHGEFYNTLEAYFAAKCLLFKQMKPHAKIFVNIDDPWGKKIAANKQNVTPFSIESNNGIHANISDNHTCMITSQKNSYSFSHTLLGRFNIYNLLAAVGVANKLGISLKNCAKQVNHFTGVPGRFELHTLKKGTRCFIDYAHNPSSFQAILSTLKTMTNDLIVIFGAGGSRDQEKRPIMGNIAAQWCDKIFLTTDNPRLEDPNRIIAAIAAGIPKAKQEVVTLEPDRKKAIEKACRMASPSSIIAILGKGPDEYQIIGNTKKKFSEKEILHTFND